MQTPTQLCIGDMVHLNSGSPALKVVALRNHKVEVEWSNQLGRLERMALPAACFRAV